MDDEQKQKVVQMVSLEEIFRAIAYAALRARASRLNPGEIIKIGEFELVVAEDENSEGMVVQIIETREQIDSMALAKAREIGVAVECWSDHDRREWMTSFCNELASVLKKWQNIEMCHGPGENITFEKAVTK
jgi:hypothetical protein